MGQTSKKPAYGQLRSSMRIGKYIVIFTHFKLYIRTN